VLATPGTVSRDYTQSLIREYAAACEVTLVGSTRLAAYAEAEMRGEPIADDLILEEIAPCFIEREAGEGRVRYTDVVTLSCTHYPLLKSRLEALAPWPVTWLDPAPAIARRMVELIGPATPGVRAADGIALFTSGVEPDGMLRAALARYRLA
jgi:glutamate racemase